MFKRGHLLLLLVVCFQVKPAVAAAPPLSVPGILPSPAATGVTTRPPVKQKIILPLLKKLLLKKKRSEEGIDSINKLSVVSAIALASGFLLFLIPLFSVFTGVVKILFFCSFVLFAGSFLTSLTAIRRYRKMGKPGKAKIRPAVISFTLSLIILALGLLLLPFVLAN